MEKLINIETKIIKLIFHFYFLGRIKIVNESFKINKLMQRFVDAIQVNLGFIEKINFN